MTPHNLAFAFTLAVVSGLLAACATTPAARNHAVVPQPRDDDRSWLKRHETIEAALSEREPRLVFMGDSITHFWDVTGKNEWAKSFGRYPSANLGIGGDRTEHLLWRLQNGGYGETTPELVVVLIGTNNLDRDSAPEIVQGISAVLDEIRARTPNTQIILLGLFPRDDAGPQISAKLAEVNAMLAATSFPSETTYVDIGEAFVESDGSISPAIMWDYLHLTAEGYRRWADALIPAIQEILGAPDA